MKYKVLIVDDESNAIEVLESIVNNQFPQIQIVGKAKNIDEAEKLINQTQPDILLLDIEMPYGTGFDILQKYPDPTFKVIFVTGFGSYAINAIKFNALDYILKPVVKEELVTALYKAINNIDKNSDNQNLKNLNKVLNNPNSEENKIVLKTAQDTFYIEVKKIIYCEAEGKYTKVYLQDGKHVLMSINIGEYEEMLSQYGFIRIHNSFLLNKCYIEKIQKIKDLFFIKVMNMDLLPISRRRKTEVLELVEIAN